MAARDKFVAMTEDGVVVIHAVDVISDYTTLCGLCDDDPSTGLAPAKLPSSPKIDCENCRKIIEAAKGYTGRDLA